MGQWLSERLGQQFVIENRPGASTTIGTEAVVRALPAGDPLLPDVEVVLQSTGVLAGAFGFVEAYTKKKQEMAGWLTDADAHVRVFAESYVRLLDRRIAAEQRRAEESLEMRKRMYDDPDDSGENQT